MSMIENLDMIKKDGLEAFLKIEETRWACLSCAKTSSVHRKNCLECGVEIEN